MCAMLYLAVGAIGFLSVVLYDLAQVRGRKGAASVLSIIGYLCILASIVFLLIREAPPVTPLGLLLFKGFLTTGLLLLLIYSVLIEIPLALKREVQTKGRRVVATGFYGLVRHPGFIWFSLLWASIDFLYQNHLVTAVGIGLVVIDFALVLMEDLVFFPRIFPEYDEYKKQVPFLIPRLLRR